MVRIIIEVRAGMVVNVLSSKDIEYTVLDFDQMDIDRLGVYEAKAQNDLGASYDKDIKEFLKENEF